jgi:phage terminase large subunit-like protein
MDLASTNDVTALSFDFVRGEQHYVKTFYYMPEQKLKDWGGETGANLRAWAEQGFIITTPGDTTDYEFVKRDLLAFNAKYEIVSIGYDPANAKQFCSDLFSNYQINMRPMNQNTSVMNAPTKMLEKLILDVNFRYDGNPVTTWMFSNVYIFMDSQERIKIIKNPDKKGVADVRNKKVDGPVSIVMAVGEATDEENVKQTWNEPFAI